MANGICVRCAKPANVVDHIVRHNNDPVLFWDVENWQPMCKLCHDSAKKRFEMTGNIAGCDSNGVPIDPNHHWNRRKGG